MQLTTDLAFGGAERVILNLARGLRGKGVECALAGLFEGGGSPARTRLMLEEDGFEVYSPGIERKRMVWPLARLHRYVKGWTPDILHCHLFHGNAAGGLLRLAGLACPQIWTHHTVERRRLPVRAAFRRLFSRLPECHVFVSDAVRRYQHAVAGAAPREELVYNGIELEPFFVVRPEPGPVFGAMGRLDPGKGFGLLVRAFARLCRENEEVRLKIAGEGPERPALEGLILREGVGERVELVGFAEDVPGFLAGVNAFVHPSRGEGFGLTLLEAMAAGLPCIASRVDSLPEIGGDLVHWVRPGDADGLYCALREMVGARYSAERIARQRAAVARFSCEAMTERYLRLYTSLLAGFARGAR